MKARLCFAHLILSNLHIVVSPAIRFLWQSRKNLAEVISDGNVSLIKAIGGFDFSREFRLIHYAGIAIANNFHRQSIRASVAPRKVSISAPNARFKYIKEVRNRIAADAHYNDLRHIASAKLRARMEDLLTERQFMVVAHYY